MALGVKGGPDLIIGRHPVLEALRAGERLDEILLAAGAKREGALAEIARRAKAAGVPLKTLPRPQLDRRVAQAMGRSANHQGVVARYGGFRYADVAEILAEGIRRGAPALILALDTIQDVHNLGSLIRSAEAAGAHGLLLGAARGAGVSAAVRKASAGAVAHQRVARVDLPQALDDLKQRGIAVFGLAAEAEVEHWEADLSGPMVLVVGGEARGLRPVVSRRCDALIRLPMRGRVDSLNAGVAGSIVLYEALRQRQEAGTES